MKLYEILGIGALSLGLIGCASSQKNKDVTPVDPVKPVESAWEYKENVYGFDCSKKDENFGIYYWACFKGSKQNVEKPHAGLRVEGHLPSMPDAYIELAIGDGYSLEPGSYNTLKFDAKVDGNVNHLSFRIHNSSSDYGSINFKDDGSIEEGSIEYDLKSYSSEELEKLMIWANKKLRAVQDELKNKFGDKVTIPKSGNWLKDLEEILNQF